MTTFSPYNIMTDGPGFLPEVLGDKDFKKDHCLYGHNGDVDWAVVDPIKYPLYVWKKGNGWYAQRARALGSSVFSNGPMMYGLSREAVKARAGIDAAAGLVGGFFIPFVGPIWGGVLGGLGGLSTIGKYVPYGPLHGAHYGCDSAGRVHDDGSAWPVDSWLYLLGRKTPNPQTGIQFSDYAIANSADTKGYDEVVTAMVPIVVGGAVPATQEKLVGFNPAYRDLVARNNGIIGWGLVGPPHGDDGVIVVAGTTADSLNAQVAAAMASVLVQNAVATDGSGSVMLGEHSEVWFEPRTTREKIARYGLCCGSS